MDVLWAVSGTKKKKKRSQVASCFECGSCASRVLRACATCVQRVCVVCVACAGCLFCSIECAAWLAGHCVNVLLWRALCVRLVCPLCVLGLPGGRVRLRCVFRQQTDDAAALFFCFFFIKIVFKVQFSEVTTRLVSYPSFFAPSNASNWIEVSLLGRESTGIDFRKVAVSRFYAFCCCCQDAVAGSCACNARS